MSKTTALDLAIQIIEAVQAASLASSPVGVWAASMIDANGGHERADAAINDLRTVRAFESRLAQRKTQ